MRIQPIIPYYYIAPPMRRKQEPEEPISFCGHLHRLMLIQQRHIMLQRMMCYMSKVAMFLGFGEAMVSRRLNKIM